MRKAGGTSGAGSAIKRWLKKVSLLTSRPKAKTSLDTKQPMNGDVPNAMLLLPASKQSEFIQLSFQKL